MKTENMVKNVQEQAFASWITYLNQLRINELLEKLAKQDINLENALTELSKLKESIAKEVVNINRGGNKGMHGFIGERIQVSFKNAKNLIDGLPKEYILIDNNGRDDYLRGSIPIQQKCVQYHLGIEAIKAHSEKYPDFLDNGGVYQIPKDYYEKLESLWSLSKEEAAKLSTSDYNTWKALQSLFAETGMTPKQLEPMDVDYADIQKGTYEKTIEKKEEEIKDRDKNNRDKAHQESKPNMKEAGKAAIVGASVEGAISLCLAIVQKHKKGIKISEYTEADWKEVGLDTGKGAVKGGIRGGAVYALTNFMDTPANIASAFVTAVYGTVANAMKYNKGEISEEEFIINSEACCVDVGVSAVSALLGEVIIPVPVLGAIIGTSIGNFMYGIAQNYCSKNVQNSINQYQLEINQLNKNLDIKYKEYVVWLENEFKKYVTVLELAFDEDINIAFHNSISLARMSGVDENKILKNKEEIENYFLK